MDILLRAIPTMVAPDTHHRAFADDIGVILSDIPTQLPRLAAMLNRFGKISGMIDNIKKTILTHFGQIAERSTARWWPPPLQPGQMSQ